MTKKRELAQKIVRQYAQGLNELNLDLIAPLLHPEFKFVYRICGSNERIIAHPDRLEEAKRRNPDRGHGIRTDIRYIGYLYRAFLEMKGEGITGIKTYFYETPIDGEKIMCIKLVPPHDRRIIFPMEQQLKRQYRPPHPYTDVSLLPRIKHGELCKIECYPYYSFDYYVGGTFYRGMEKQ